MFGEMGMNARKPVPHYYPTKTRYIANSLIAYEFYTIYHWNMPVHRLLRLSINWERYGSHLSGILADNGVMESES